MQLLPVGMMSIPKIPEVQQAIIQDDVGKPKLVNNSRIPKLSPGDILVKTSIVALNHSDYKMGVAFPSPGAIIGHDFVGMVVQIHEKTRTNIKINDMVCGIVHGSNPADHGNGAFAQYLRVPADLVLRVPESFNIEDAASIGTGVVTACVALWESGLKLKVSPEVPANESFPVLVYGASTATGTMVLQLLALSGVRTIATCSPHNFGLVHSYGADTVFDYADSETPANIKKNTNGELEHALDIITDPDSIACCYASISRFGGQYTSLELCPPALQTRRAVQSSFPMALEVFGKQLELYGGYERPACEKTRTEAVARLKMFQRLLDDGKLRAQHTLPRNWFLPA